MLDEVRSRRSAARPAVVLGRGPVAAGIAAGLGAPAVERLDDEALAGTSALVLVVYEADRASTGEGSVPARVAAAVAGVQDAVAAAGRAGVRHVVLVTSAVVHGAWADRPDIDDDDPLTAADERWEHGLMAELLAADAAFAGAPLAERDDAGRGPSAGEVPMLRTTLRAASVVAPGADTLVGRHLEAPRLLRVRGSDRRWQFVHVDDLAHAVALVLDEGLTGSLTVGAEDTLSTDEVARAAGLPQLTLPEGVAFGLAERLHRAGALRTPPAELGFVVHSWTVTSRRLREAGWRPARTSAQCLDELVIQVRGRHAIAGRRLGARDAATAGAVGAGAAVALAAMAAAVRRARR